jgi:hypothetical protein
VTAYALLTVAGYVVVLAYALHYSRQNSGGA